MSSHTVLTACSARRMTKTDCTESQNFLQEIAMKTTFTAVLNFFLLIVLPCAANARAVIVEGNTTGNYIYEQNVNSDDGYYRTRLPGDFYGTKRILLGDMDEDGDLDIMTGMPREAALGDDFLYLHNNDTGRYDKVQIVQSGATYYPSDLGDWDGDGDLDVLQAGGSSSKLWVQFNGGIQANGEVDFSTSVNLMTLIDAGEYFQDCVFFDLNGDGHLDIIAITTFYAGGHDLNRIRVIYNNGSGGIASHHIAYQDNVHRFHQLTVADLNNDHHPELLIKCYGNKYQLFFNNGTDNFFILAAFPNASGVKQTDLYYTTAVFSDIDNDTDLDLVVGGGGKLWVWENIGIELLPIVLFPVTKFAQVEILEGTTGSEINEILSVDLNGDEYPDIITAHNGYPNRKYVNNGGNLDPPTNIYATGYNTSTIKFFHSFNIKVSVEGLPTQLADLPKQTGRGFYPLITEPKSNYDTHKLSKKITAPRLIKDTKENCYYTLAGWYGSGDFVDYTEPNTEIITEDDLQELTVNNPSEITWVYEKAIKFEVVSEGEADSKECSGGIGAEDCVAENCPQDMPSCAVSSGVHYYPENTTLVLTTLAVLPDSGPVCGGLNTLSGDEPVTGPHSIDDRMTYSLNLTQNTSVLWNYSNAEAVEVGTVLQQPDIPGTCGGTCTLTGAPAITISIKDQADTTVENGFFWAESESLYYLARPISLFELEWPISDCTCTGDDVDFNKQARYGVWPEPNTNAMQTHIAGAPANLNGGNNGYEFDMILFSEKNEAETAAPAGVFNPTQPGRNVLLFASETDPVEIKVVETILMLSELAGKPDIPWNIGTAISDGEHGDPEEKNGYIYYENSVYDGSGSSKAYDRTTRTGEILPVNTTDAETAIEKQMVVVWYKQDTVLGIGWPTYPLRYLCQWPSGAEIIAIADGNGYILSGDELSEPTVYNQPDVNLTGFNPNEEHALIQGNVLYALSNQLNKIENHSEPYVLLKYLEGGIARMKVFKVEFDPAVDSISFAVNAGSPILAPTPIDLLAGVPPSHPTDGQEFYLLDHKGGHWAKNAGIGEASGDIHMRWYYPLLEGFYYPSSFRDSLHMIIQTGAPIPLLNGGNNHTDDPMEVVYTVSWPQDAPELYVGETLMRAKYGLPDVANMASAQVIFDEELFQGRRPMVKLYAPLAERKVTLAELPDTILTESIDGKFIFPELVYSLKSRILYDPREEKLIFKGLLNEQGLGEPLLLANVMTVSERDLLLDFGDSNTSGWNEAVEELFSLSRNPKGIVDISPFFPSFLLPGMNPPYSIDTWGILLGLSEQYDPWKLYMSTIYPEKYPPEELTSYLAHGKINGQKMALTAGMAQGEGWVVLAENNDESLGASPVQLHIIKVGQGPYRGEIKVIKSDNVFDEKLTLRHTGDFGGEPENVYIQWYSKPDINGIPPLFPEDQETLNADGWTLLDDGWGKLDTIIEGAGKLTLSDNWIMARYYYGHAYPQLRQNTEVGPEDTPTFVNTSSDWSGWAGGPGNESAQLAEGWIKRVFDSLNLMETRVTDFLNNPTNTRVSMIAQLGERYEGAVALNGSAENLNSMGMISAYETILNRGMLFSIDNGDNYGPANNALLLAASKLADFYTLLGNEAYADAVDPTIGFDTQAGEYGSIMPSIFSFQNQLDSLLDEELILLRGRDNSMSTTRATPIYNRLIWNFTRDIGEVAYTTCYNISDMDNSGVINEYDAQVLYPQGHGDAWGHYLHAMSYWYKLLRHDQFTWEPRIEAVLVGGAPIPVDYLDERKFAEVAAAKARAGAEVVNMTYRQEYVDDPAGQWQGYKDTDSTRAWGVDGWARRAGQGAYFDWVVGNALLPDEDPNSTHKGLNKIDRTTVHELQAITSAYNDIQSRIDESDNGLNPVGLAKGVVPFDIDPTLIDSGQTHFEQIHSRAVQALNNAATVFANANNYTRMLRNNEETLDDFKDNLDDQERDYLNRLIELFGYPYAGDIGTAGFYPDGYNGPDWLHFMYMDLPDLTGVANTVGEIKEYNTTWNVDAEDFDEDLGITSENVQISYKISENDVWFAKPEDWGSRRAPGEIQMALSDTIQADTAFKLALHEYKNAITDIDSAKASLELKHGVVLDQIEIKNTATNKRIAAAAVYAALATAQFTLDWMATTVKETAAATAASIPTSVGMSNDVGSGVRGAIKQLGVVQGAGVRTLMTPLQSAMLLTKAGAKTIDGVEKYDLFIADAKYEVEQLVREMDGFVNAAIGKLYELLQLQEVLNQSLGRYYASLAKAERLLTERAAIRARAAADIQEYRYQDMGFRVFRNDALQKYRASFDLAARYVYLAATAYDYETNLLGSDYSSGQGFLTDIVKQRALGEISDGIPVAGSFGLADPLARLEQNFAVYKRQLGFNNPQTETNRFSFRTEQFRIHADSSSLDAWKTALGDFRVPDLWQIPEFRKYCRPFAPEYMGAQPGLVIPFSTEVTFGKNYFGWPLSGGDSSYDPSNFATKIRSVGVWFSDYDTAGLSSTPRIYLVPVGVDILRSPSGDGFARREWQVVDQKLPVPFTIGASDLTNDSWIPRNDSLSGEMAATRKFSSFRAYHDSGFFVEDETISDSRLIGRSVWNTSWLMIIPGGSLLHDQDAGLENFINSVSDIKLFFQTYAYSGN